MKTPDLQVHLLTDHARLEKLYEDVMSAFHAGAREETQRLWTELERRLEAHFTAEERLLFPRFAKLDRTETAALEGEHARLREALSELGVGVDLKEVREEVARGFIELLRAHAARENALLYRWARETLAGLDANAMVEAVESTGATRTAH